MFGLLKRRRDIITDPAQQAANETALLLETVRSALPAGAVGRTEDDPFLLGLVAAYASAMTRAFAGPRSTQVMVESAEIAAAELTLGPPAPSRAEAVAALRRSRGLLEFRQAAEVAELIVGGRYGHGTMLDDPRLTKARQRVAAMPKAFRLSFGATQAEQVATLLIEDLVLEPLRAQHRFRSAAESQREALAHQYSRG